MKKIGLKMDDLAPQRAMFHLSTLPGIDLTLKVFSLRERIYVNRRWPNGEVEKVFSEVQIEGISEICYLLLEDASKIRFKDYNDFCEHVVDQDKDVLAIVKAVLQTIGIGEPQLEKISEAIGEAPKLMPNQKKTKRKK
jgi:hypothetical protein